MDRQKVTSTLHERAAGYPYDSSRGKAAPWELKKVRTHVIMRCMDAQHTKHVTYKLAYHFVWCPKYRKKLLVGSCSPTNKGGITSMRWGWSIFPNTWGISLAIWVGRLPPMKLSTTGKHKPNWNIFVGRSPCRIQEGWEAFPSLSRKRRACSR